MTDLLKKHGRKTLKLALPVMMSQLGHIMVGVADSLMVGQLGKAPLAAASLANSLFAVIMVFGIGTSFIMTPLIAQADGEKNIERIRIALVNGTWILLILGIALAILLQAGLPLMHYIGQPEEVVALAKPYLSIIGFSLIPLMFYQAQRQFVEGLSYTKEAMYISVGANILNVIFNYILIFGKLGFPAMGLNGAGVSTLISRIIMAVAIFMFIKNNHRFHSYTHQLNPFQWGAKVIGRILRLGFPMGMQFTFEVTTFSMAAIMMGWLGTVALAAHQIAINLASVSYMAATGISSAATIRVGNQLGQKDYHTMREVSFTSYQMALIFMGFCALAFVVFRTQLAGLYIDNPEVIHLAAQLLIMAGLFQLSDGAQVIGLGSLRGITDVKAPTIITLIAYWGLGLPIGYILGFRLEMGALGIWTGLLLGLTIAAIWLFYRFNKLSGRMLINSQKQVSPMLKNSVDQNF
ncbi:MAG TPA: MATE family efflux transporter [Cytophagales bacterium]|jgi:MATE family multidrug resistance protein|nr:MATE family efflux transporter [Cytophagales bacterium]